MGRALDELFAWVIAAGGVITGDHGLGLAKKKWRPLAADKVVREVHGALKAALDPKGFLNPGKVRRDQPLSSGRRFP